MLGSQPNGMGYVLDVVWVVLACRESIEYPAYPGIGDKFVSIPPSPFPFPENGGAPGVFFIWAIC